MAIFEKTSQSKVTIDDTDKLICFVENAQNINKHTEYSLKVQRGPLKENMWHVSRRYRDFAALHECLQHSNIELPLPPKKLIGNRQPSFVAERQIALQKYIDEILKHPSLSLSLQVRSFLDPNNYSLSIADQALQTVSIALRGDGRFELKASLSDIGWRIRKQYFLVMETERRTNCILSWQDYGLDKYLEHKDMQSSFKSLLNISHPYIDQILAIHNLENGAYVVRKLHEKGSVKDILYGTDYSKPHLSKYGNPKTRKPFTDGQIAHYGLQILQALKFLNDKNVPHGHLHPGNIVIENQKALLLDIENCLIGGSCLYRPHILEQKRICTAEAVDVYCFGHTLYEMALASPLQHSYCDYFPEGISAQLEVVLRLCLSSWSCKHGLPSLDQLLENPFFTHSHSLTNGLASCEDGRIHLKFPLPLKMELKKAVEAKEARLKSDQKLVRNAKREVRLQEILNSMTSEEMKKQKRRLKKREDSVWKSTLSLADTVRSHSVSTASSPTPPALPETSRNSTSMSITPVSPQDGRSALLSAICAFDKNKLSRINSQ